MANIYIALGSNLDNPVNQLKIAISTIATTSDFILLEKSSFYETAPIGFADQPNFINAVIKITSEQSPHDVLYELQNIEHTSGRIRIKKNEPRTLDLDILLIDNLVLDTPKLILPHPRMHERLFTLMPLLEIDPDFSMPNFGSIKKLASLITSQLITRIDS
jgi:2-amino-4-hydroxy-6-hydroxymethyldihydropteridine diphosphokinase